MKTIKLVMMLSVSAFLLAPCVASPGNSGLQTEASDQNDWQTEASDQNDWQTYTSARHGFTIQYPSAWQVM